jgi:TPP-dependent pyruvate/acetoin dehydrogenase alpha subunit
MITAHTVETLQAFEESIADEFNAGNIPFPVHLESGNEAQLIDVFRDIRSDDWICGSWRMHLKCLLKGVPEDELRYAIHRGESMTLCFPDHKIVSSAIVGGILPIATGIALSIKRRGGAQRVHCFVGDMTWRTGIAHECAGYGLDLPIRWIIEDNGLSVCTPTADVWPDGTASTCRFSYKSKWPHAGAGQRVQF